MILLRNVIDIAPSLPVPSMSHMEYADLLNDIKQNGILQCLYINYGNVILDGHHRFKAEKELGIKEVEVSIPELFDISKYEYLISVALNRRQLSEVVKKRFQGSLLENLSRNSM